jgi:hypothetical protein
LRRVARGFLFVSVAVVCLAVSVPAGASSEVTTVTVKAAGISVSYPSDWISVALTKRGFARQMAALAKTQPKLAREMKYSRPTDPDEKFVAVDFHVGSSTPTHDLIVYVARSGAASSPSELGGSIKRSFRGDGNLWALTAGENDIDGHTGYLVRYTEQPVIPGQKPFAPSRMGELELPRGSGMVLVMVGGTDDPTTDALIQTVISSVHVT